MVATEEFSAPINGIIQPGPASILPDVTPSSFYRGDARLETIGGREYLAASLSEGTITDSTPGSAVNHRALSLEEGTLLSSVSSYRSIAQRPPGLCLSFECLKIAVLLFLRTIILQELHLLFCFVISFISLVTSLFHETGFCLNCIH